MRVITNVFGVLMHAFRRASASRSCGFSELGSICYLSGKYQAAKAVRVALNLPCVLTHFSAEQVEAEVAKTVWAFLRASMLAERQAPKSSLETDMRFEANPTLSQSSE